MLGSRPCCPVYAEACCDLKKLVDIELRRPLARSALARAALHAAVRHTVPGCGALCCAVLALLCTVLCCAALCSAEPAVRCTALCCAALRCVVLCCAVLYWPCAVLCCARLCNATLCSAVLALLSPTVLLCPHAEHASALDISQENMIVCDDQQQQGKLWNILVP